MTRINYKIGSYGEDNKTALEAKFEAQKIAFGPIMFQATVALRNLGILKTVCDHKRRGISIKEVAEKTEVSEYGVKVLLEAGLSIGLVYVVEDKFFCTKVGWFVLNDTLTRVNIDFTNDVNYLGFAKLEESIKTGEPKGLETFGNWSTIYEGLSKLPEQAKKSWFAFDHFYSDMAFPEILPIIFNSNPKKGLDVGGNTGKFAIKCAESNPDIEITILDLPNQLKVANENIKERGFSDRISGHPIDLLDHSIAYPTGYDFVWMSQFLDCFSLEDIVALINKGKEALTENGKLYILETYWDKQRFEASTYSLHATSLYFTCLANGRSQMYHHNDMLQLIEKAGMIVEKEYEEIGISHTLYQCIKA
jgi:ubiquinone/menaquinone biosynthesis C-methylase UbiE